MKIFNIYPVKNQSMYKNEDFSMILAHLVEKKLYDPKNFNQNRYIIMDNGAYESSRVSTNLRDLVTIARSSGIVVDEIVIPDVIGDYEKTKQLFNDNYNVMKENAQDFNFMYVAHVSNLDQLKEAIDIVNDEYFKDEVSITLGIPKHCKINRYGKEAIELYKKCHCPIHFLGIKENYEELECVNGIIRSCDSAQICYIARDHFNSNYMMNQKRIGKAIDLENDCIENNKLQSTKDILTKELLLDGLL